MTREQELEAALREARGWMRVSANGHAHMVPGVWDWDGRNINAGKPCDACAPIVSLKARIEKLLTRPAPPASEPTREALLESVVRDARAYCKEMLSPEWLADPANRDIFGARVYALLAAAKESR